MKGQGYVWKDGQGWVKVWVIKERECFTCSRLGTPP